MKLTKLLTASVVAMTFATSSFAGTLTEPEVDIVIEPAKAANSSGGMILPLVLLGALVAVVASD